MKQTEHGLRPIFRMSGQLSEMHEQYLDERSFELIGTVDRFPRYVNKRMIDPQVRCFLDEKKIDVSWAWNLPQPNEEAAYISLSKYAKSHPNMDVVDVARLNKSWDWLENHFGSYMQDARVKSLEEVIPTLDMSTSTGVPFNHEFPTKKELFEADESIKEWLEEDWEVLGSDPEWTCVFTNSLKEELRPKSKIVINSLRTFTAGPVDATVHGGRLFQDMNEKFYAAHLTTSSAVGMSPYGGNWHRLYEKLAIFKNGYALDESQYDSSLFSSLMWGCALFRWRMLRESDRTESNLLRIRTYYRNLVNAVICTPEGILVMKKTGNPSGSVNTISDNTLILYVLLSYAWIASAPEDMNSYECFETHTAKALNGDDNTFTVSDKANSFFNAKNIIEKWKLIGITGTTDVEHARPAHELDFLSATFVKQYGTWVPLYSRDKLLTTLLFAPRQNLTPETTLERCGAILQCGWTDQEFRALMREFIAWLIGKYDRLLCEDVRWIMAKKGILCDARIQQLYTGSKLILPIQCHRDMEGTIKICKYYSDYSGVCWAKLFDPRKITCRDPRFSCVYDEGDPRTFLTENPTMRVPTPMDRWVPNWTGNMVVPKIHPQSVDWEVQERLRSPIKAEMSSATVVVQKPKQQQRRRRRQRRRGRQGGGQQNVPKTVMVVQQPQGRRKRRKGANRSLRNLTGISGVGIQRGGEIVNTRTHSAPEIREGEELISTVLGSVAFTTTQFNINPANAITFPWLSKIAQLFERYEFEALSFHFGHDVSGFATQGQTGLVYLSALYDAAAAAPTAVNQIEATDPFVPCMPNQDSKCRLDKKSMHPANEPKYCLQGNPPGASDIKTYNVGSLFVTTTGMANASEIGKLRVKYRVKLFDRVLDASTAAAPANFSVSMFQNTAAQGVTTATPSNLLLATASANGLAIVNTAGSFVPPPGNYQVDLTVVGKDTSLETFTTKIDIQKNAVTVFQRPLQSVTTTPANGQVSNSASFFVIANGTDAFTFPVTFTGAAGTLTVDAATVKWSAV